MLRCDHQLASNFVYHLLSRECTVKQQYECSESEPHSEAVDQTAKQWAETRYEAEGSCWFMWSFSSSWATSFTLSYCLCIVISFKVIFRPIWPLFDETERRGKKKVGIEAKSLLSIQPPYMGRTLCQVSYQGIPFWYIVIVEISIVAALSSTSKYLYFTFLLLYTSAPVHFRGERGHYCLPV